MPSSGPTTAFDDLPYMDDYLREILRPRAEQRLDNVRRFLRESVWRHLSRLLAQEQPEGEASAAVIRHLLEDRLGLRIEITLDARFGGDSAAPPSATDPPLVVTTIRPGGMPLVNAVLADGDREPRP